MRSRVFAPLFVLHALLIPLVSELSAQEKELPFALTLRSPVDYAVFQRNSPTEGIVLLEGSVTPKTAAKTLPDKLEVRLVGEGAPGQWSALAFDKRVPSFRSTLKAPAGGWFKLEVRAFSGGSAETVSIVDHVGIGEVFVVAGQSNSANHGAEKLKAASPLVAAMVAPGKWQPCADPQPGSSGGGGSFVPPLGDALAARFKVPVGFVSSGVGASSVREWMPRGMRFSFLPTITGRVTTVGPLQWESDGTIYQTFAEKVRALGPNGFRAVLWHQGESDANQADPSRTFPGYLYKTHLESLIRQTRLSAGWEAPWFVAQVSYHVPGDEFSPEIRLAQRMLWENGTALEGPDSDALTGNLRDNAGKGVHFSAEGLREHAARWNAKLAPWLEKQLASAAQTPAPQPNRPPLPQRLSAHALFSDRMVLQRGMPVPVWGAAPPNETVTVEFAGQKKTTKASATGAWKVVLDPMEARSEGLPLGILSESGEFHLREVLVGEVWLASGQSNMQWSFSHQIEDGEAELNAAEDPGLRQFTVKKGGAPAPGSSVEGGWHRATRNELLTGLGSGDSAVAYFFAKELRRVLGVPVGVLNASVGGTPIEQWVPGGGLYNAMVHPLAPYALRGAVWYQGESNCLVNAGSLYTGLQTGLVSGWRKLWNQGDFPFFYVQIAPWVYSQQKRGSVELGPETLPDFWMAQTAAMQQANTGMVVINDITGDPRNIHPPNKKEVGRRLAAWALGTVFEKKDTAFRSPLFSAAKPEGNALRVTFVHAEEGLITKDKLPPSHLELAGEDGVFHAATATLEGSSLLVRSENVPQPRHVRYGWSETAMPNLAAKNGLPVAPFHSAKWPLKTAQR